MHTFLQPLNIACWHNAEDLAVAPAEEGCSSLEEFAQYCAKTYAPPRAVFCSPCVLGLLSTLPRLSPSSCLSTHTAEPSAPSLRCAGQRLPAEAHRRARPRRRFHTFFTQSVPELIELSSKSLTAMPIPRDLDGWLSLNIDQWRACDAHAHAACRSCQCPP